MALPLYIPSCLKTSKHPNHPPDFEKPLRIQIEGPLTLVQKLVPDAEWHIKQYNDVFPQPAGLGLARIAYAALYGREADSEEIAGDLIVRNEYLGWVMEGNRPLDEIDYYGVTFDHLVPSDDQDPEVLQINMYEMDYDDGAYVHATLPFKVDPAEYTGKKVLGVHRCCQRRKGTTDRFRVNSDVIDKEKWDREKLEHKKRMLQQSESESK